MTQVTIPGHLTLLVATLILNNGKTARFTQRCAVINDIKGARPSNPLPSQT